MTVCIDAETGQTCFYAFLSEILPFASYPKQDSTLFVFHLNKYK